MMGVINVTGTGLGNGVHYRIRDNDDIKRTSAFTFNNDEINFFSRVDWVLTRLQTPWSRRYIPAKVYKHVDINCGLIVPQQVNNDNKYILYHAEIPGDGGLVVPQQRSYMKVRSSSFNVIQTWITNETGGLDDTLPFEKTRVILHVRKKPLQTM